MTEEQLTAVRRYTSAEVVQMLNIPAKWLKELVRERRVPHQRTGLTNGVCREWRSPRDARLGSPGCGQPAQVDD